MDESQPNSDASGETLKGRSICAWCKKDMGSIEYTNGMNSHGMCGDCVVKTQKEIDKMAENLDPSLKAKEKLNPGK